jgi:hypothetical protein
VLNREQDQKSGACLPCAATHAEGAYFLEGLLTGMS